MSGIRSLAVIAALVVLPALAAFNTDGRLRDFGEVARAGARFWASFTQSTPAVAAYVAEYRVLPDGGEGVPVAMELCDAVPESAKTGNWYCIYSDGGLLPGSSLTWAPIAGGTSTALPLTICPSGQTCGPLLHTEMIDGGGVESSAYNATGTPFTACGVWNTELTFAPAKRKLAGNAAGYFTSSGWAWYADENNGSYAFAVWDDALNYSIARNVAIARGADQVLCGIYHNDPAKGVETFKTAVWGESGGTMAAGIGTTGQPLRHTVSAYNFEGAGVVPPIRNKGFFYTEKVLDAGVGMEMFSMMENTNAITLRSAGGEATIGRRSSSLACSADTSFGATSGSVVIGHTMCRAQGKLYSGREGTNLLTRSNAMDETAVWVDVGTPARHLGSVRDHFGTMQSMVLDDNDNGAAEGIVQTAFTAGATGKYHLSCWLMSQDGGTGRLRMVGASNSVGDSDCSWPLTPVSTRYACSSDAGYTVDPVTIATSVLVGGAASDVGSASVVDCQLEQGYKPGGYVQSHPSAQVRNYDHTYGDHNFDAGIRSASGWVLVPSALSGTHNIINVAAQHSGAHVNAWFSDDGGHLHCSFLNADGFGADQASAAAFTLGQAQRWGCFYDDAGVPTACVDSSCTSGAASPSATDNDDFRVHLGHDVSTSGRELDSFLWNVCLDRSPVGCDYR